jgi:hypothetical protein
MKAVQTYMLYFALACDGRLIVGGFRLPFILKANYFEELRINQSALVQSARRFDFALRNQSNHGSS